MCALGLQKKAKVSEEIVKLAGKKLRAGTVPWRLKDEQIEVFLIEGINTPGQWSFPAGSLDPGEELECCASRETYEECGARGRLGCFLGTFEEKHRSYFFALQVTQVDDEGNETWHDPASAYEGSNLRRRRWFNAQEAHGMLKKDGPKILEAFLGLPITSRLERRIPRPFQLLLVGGDDHLAQRLAPVLRVPCEGSEAQRFAVLSALLWEATAAVLLREPYAAALAAAHGCPALLLEERPSFATGDGRLRCKRLQEVADRKHRCVCHSL